MQTEPDENFMNRSQDTTVPKITSKGPNTGAYQIPDLKIDFSNKNSNGRYENKMDSSQQNN